MLKRAGFAVLAAIVVFLIFGAFGWAPASAQKTQKAVPDDLQHEVTVTVKLVQVYVTDAKGNPARDLEMSDFVLYDNGRLQTITGFEKHFLPVPAAAAEVKVGETQPLPPRDAASLMNRKFVFLFDFASNDLEGIMKSRQAALEFMDTQVQPGDEIALLSYVSIRRLTLHEYFTSDHEKIRRTINKIKGVPGVVDGWMSFAYLGHSIMGTELPGGPTLDRGTGTEARAAGEPEGAAAAAPSGEVTSGRAVIDFSGSAAARLFTEAMTELAKAFRHIPGKKNIIFFSRGSGPAGFNPKSKKLEVQKFVTMAKELASADAPVFPVNTTTGVVGRVAAGVFADGSLEYLSKMTGGKYLGDIDYPARVAQALQDATGNYYVLGYSVASTWDGKFHEIKVEVKRPGYQVHAQGGYFNPRPFNTYSPVEKHLQLLDLALGEKAYFEQHLNFPMVAQPFSDNKDANTLLISEVPAQRLRETVGDKTELIMLVFDEDRNIVDSKRVEMNWGTIKGERICQYGTAGLAPGRYDCRIVIRNLDSGKAAVGACAVDIPEKDAGAKLKLYPPLLLIPGREARYLNVSAENKAGAPEAITLSDVYPYPQKEFSPLVGGLASGAKTLCAAVRCAWGSGLTPEVKPEVQFSAWLVQEGSDQKTDLTVNLLGIADQDGARVSLLEFELPELQPGGYLLHVLAEDLVSNATSETSSALSIVLAGGLTK